MSEAEHGQRSDRFGRPPPYSDSHVAAHAFTLIELLVVVAVIAILASLLLPALNRAKIAADSAVCKSNLRQHAIAVRLYVDDFQVYPPYAMQDHDNVVRFWHERLVKYTGIRWVDCRYDGPKPGNPLPGTPRSIRVCPSYLKLRGSFTSNTGSYGYNRRGFGPTPNNSLGLGGNVLVPTAENAPAPSEIVLTPDSAVVRPSDMILIADAQPIDLPDSAWDVLGNFHGTSELIGIYHGVRYEVRGPGWNHPEDSTLKDQQWYQKRHGNRWNVAFCDGHVENLRTARLYDGRNQMIVRRWNRDNSSTGRW